MCTGTEIHAPPLAASRASVRKMKRAALACMHCRSRKVRCSVMFEGVPCSNCRNGGLGCRLVINRRISQEKIPSHFPYREHINFTTSRSSQDVGPSPASPPDIQTPIKDTPSNPTQEPTLPNKPIEKPKDTINRTLSPPVDHPSRKPDSHSALTPPLRSIETNPDSPLDSHLDSSMSRLDLLMFYLPENAPYLNATEFDVMYSGIVREGGGMGILPVGEAEA